MEMSFGKYKGKSVEEVYRLNSSYFAWMKEQGMTKKDEYQYYIEVIPSEYPESFVWEVDIRDKYVCWKCSGAVKIMLFFNPEIENEFREGIPIISDLAYNKPESLIPFAKDHGVLLESRFSKQINEKYVAHICPHCKMLQGDNFVVEDNHQDTILKKRISIRYDQGNGLWREQL